MSAGTQTDEIEVTVLLPCLNEERTVADCIAQAQGALAQLGIRGEVLVADNGSTDGSRSIAARAGARVVEIADRGYGAALRGGILQARGRYVLMADADGSYALDSIEDFVAALRRGSALVIGNRFRGGIDPGAMPALHRYLGNPVLSLVGRTFFNIPVRDFHCGMRAFDRQKAIELDFRSDGMEFASEMVVKFALAGHRITEVPTPLRRDGRDRPPHLRSWRDGWRHLRFLLLFSPKWLFFYPGVVLALLGAVLTARLAYGPLDVGIGVMDTQALLFSAGMLIVGVQSILLAVLSHYYTVARGMRPASARGAFLSHPHALERGALAGAAFLAIGVVGAGVAVLRWARQDFGPLQLAQSMRWSIPSIACLVVGAEILMASFFLGLLHLDETIAPGSTAHPAEPDR